jgi:hypothetical protein
MTETMRGRADCDYGDPPRACAATARTELV